MSAQEEPEPPRSRATLQQLIDRSVQRAMQNYAAMTGGVGPPPGLSKLVHNERQS